MNNTREHILNVSFKLFLQKNFKEVTMKEIVEKTGISKGAFYHHFESKEQLFLEVLNNALSSVTTVYKNLSKVSLHQFYHEYFKYYQNAGSFFPTEDGEEEMDGFDLNIYSLFFEGIKLFPGIQEKLHECIQIELNAWKEVIHISRDNGEIKSLMTDEQIAKLFIFASDGIGMQSIILNENSKGVRDTLIDLWDSFYNDLIR
jgi:TetR/AcrR family transcriptional regulator, transcriptional repressor for nem operon